MRDLNLTEVAQVNGGVAPLLIIGGAAAGGYVLGWIGGYVKEKRDQQNKEKEAQKQS